MDNPYRARENYAYWRLAVSGLAPDEVDPITAVAFRITPEDKIATAGSCFAQHIARTLQKRGYQYFVTEASPLSRGAADENYGVYSARFGNIYTTRQLGQLFDRAYGFFEPVDTAWRAGDGRYLDPFRPQIQKNGFASIEALQEDRVVHLGAVRRMIEGADVFVFTLGLTEVWLSAQDGAAFPSAPGVVGAEGDPERYTFHNLAVAEMHDELVRFIDNARVVNPDLKVMLTVSPVPLVATYEDRHVAVSTELSKSALRVVADSVSRARPAVVYFPSYEIITSHFSRGVFFEPDMRSVSEAGVSRVMTLFGHHFLSQARHGDRARVDRNASEANWATALEHHQTFENVVCDEEAVER